MGEHGPTHLVLAGLLGDLQRGQVAAWPGTCIAASTRTSSMPASPGH